jgi:hypothetical protein
MAASLQNYEGRLAAGSMQAGIQGKNNKNNQM